MAKYCIKIEFETDEDTASHIENQIGQKVDDIYYECEDDNIKTALEESSTTIIKY